MCKHAIFLPFNELSKSKHCLQRCTFTFRFTEEIKKNKEEINEFFGNNGHDCLILYPSDISI